MKHAKTITETKRITKPTINSLLILPVLLFSLLNAPATLANDKTENPTSTDSEGMDPNQKAGDEKKKNETKNGSTQTWGGGPKHGALHEDWQKWIVLIGKNPKGPTPIPPKTEPAPKDPKNCARVTKEWHNEIGNITAKDEDSKAAYQGWIRGVQHFCTP